ncbi:MAG TPA: hypothetical protein VH302_07390 [Bryobacteraceae bacterium]|nr:hypothetical protein [Bryobacteraceae bacterium]
MADYLLGYMSTSEGQFGEVVAQLHNWYTGLYFQDSWKITSKVTLNYGLRYELQPGYKETYKEKVGNRRIAPRGTTVERMAG